MYQPIKKLKMQAQERIDSGETCIGAEIVPTTYPRYTAQGEITQESNVVTGRKIPLTKIRQKLLEKHEDLGLIRLHSDEYYSTVKIPMYTSIKFQYRHNIHKYKISV